MRLRLPQRRRARVALYVTSILLIALAIDLVLVQRAKRVPHDHATTRVTGPVLSDGRIDYLTAIEDHFAAGVTPGNNAAIPLIEALGRAALAKNQPRDGVTNRLGMPPVPDDGDYFVLFPSDSSDEGLDAPWTADERPQVAAWLKSNARALQKIEEASRRPRFWIPYTGGYRPETLIEVLLPYLQPTRSAGQALVARAMLRVNEGDIDGARADVMTLHRLARLVSQEATLVEKLVGYGIESMACNAEQVIAGTGKLTAPQAKAWLADLEALSRTGPPWQGPGESIDWGERMFGLDLIQLGAYTSNAHYARLLEDISSSAAPQLRSDARYFYWNFIPVDYGRTMRTANGVYDDLLAAMKLPDYPSRRAKLAEWNQRVAGLKIESATSLLPTATSDAMLALLVPSLDRMNESETSIRANAALARAAMALAVFHAENGHYPPTLDALVPAILPAAPIDPFTGTRLVYRASAPSGYVMYSIGPNLLDDGAPGTSAPQRSDKRADDIAVRVGDAVAPTSTTTTRSAP